MADEGREIPCGSASNVHVLTTLLIDYLIQLPNPVLTTYRYDRFLKAAQNVDPLARVRGIKNVVDTLPAHNRQLLTTLVRMWADMCDKHGVPPTVSTPFIQTLSPILLRPTAAINEANENEKALCCLAIADLIRHHEPILGTLVSGDGVTKLKYGHYPTLSPAQARKLISTQIPGGIPPPPLHPPSDKTPEQADKTKQPFKRHQGNKEKMEHVMDNAKLLDTKMTDSCDGDKEAMKGTNTEFATKIVVNYQKDQQFVVNISKDNPATLTLDDFRRACDCPGGCLQDMKYPTRILIAGNIVVSPGLYQMIISHQSNMTQFNKRFSIPHTSPAFLHIQQQINTDEEEEEMLCNFSWEEVGI